MRGKSECFGGVCDARLDDFFVDGNARHGVDIAHRRHADDDDFVEPRRFRDVEKSNRLGLSAPIFEFDSRFFAQFTRAALAPRLNPPGKAHCPRHGSMPRRMSNTPVRSPSLTGTMTFTTGSGLRYVITPQLQWRGHGAAASSNARPQNAQYRSSGFATISTCDEYRNTSFLCL